MNVASKNYLAMLGFTLMALSWLAPNKAYPWLTGWNEGLALFSVLFLWFGIEAKNQFIKEESVGLAWPVAVFAALAIGLPWLQHFTGLLVFSGDAFVIALYFGFFLMAVRVGAAMGRDARNNEWGVIFSAVVVLAALISVGIALIQWTKTWDLAVFIMESGGQETPGANLGQINHQNTLCFIGFCCAFYLFVQKKLVGFVFFLLCFCLCLGMVLTKSRTGWLQMSFFCAVVLLFCGDRRVKIISILMVALYLLMYLISPRFEVLALLSAERIYRPLPVNDVRMIMWSALLNASSLKPWFGFGWLQTGWAQQAVALDYPIQRSYMSYSHNFVLDLIVWCGWPLAILMAILILLWFFFHFSKNLKEALYFYCAIAGVFIHGLLEYPLAYAYFLMPVGLMMGFVDGRVGVFREYLEGRISRRLATVVMSCLLLVVAVDYVKAVSLDVAVRMHSSQIGRSMDSPELDLDFILLNQLKAMYAFRLIQKDDFMNESNIALMERVIRRYPYSPALFQYAWVLAVRGRIDEAEHQLRILCGIYSIEHCKMLRKRWEGLKNQYPESVGKVNFPGQ